MAMHAYPRFNERSRYSAPNTIGFDDISSLHNFICILITFWSSQGNLSNKKSRKNWRNYKEAKRVTIGRKHDTIWEDQNMLLTLWKTCHDRKNVTWFGKTLIQLFVIQRKTCHDFGRISVPI